VRKYRPQANAAIAPAAMARKLRAPVTLPEPAAMHCVFIQIRCRPGTTYAVADAVVLRELHSELYSTSGEFDLLLKLYVPEGEDVGRYINDRLLDIDGIERTLTTLTFKTF